MSFWSLFFRERSIAYKLETSVQRPWFVTPFRPRHLSYLHLIGKNNAIPEISIGTTHLLPILAPLISPHLEQMPHSARSPASELGDLRWRHEVGIGFEGRAPLKARDPSLIPATPHGNGAADGLDTTAD